MNSIDRAVLGRSARVIAFAIGVCAVTAPARADDPTTGTYEAKDGLKARRKGYGYGTLGYGPPGRHLGFQGFGIGYHPGYGFGGDALGVGCDGGYPYYGGPGYPHPAPALQRIGGINPFAHFAGPGSPTPDHPNFFGVVGPLVVDKPVITIGDLNYDTGYGCFTGALPYPESAFAPFTSEAAQGGTNSRVITPSPTNAPTPPPPPGAPSGSASIAPTPPIGIDTSPVVDPDGSRGLTITRVYPGTAADQAGLHAADVIQSINGFQTRAPEDLAWIKAHAAPDRLLKIVARTASDGRTYTYTTQLR